MKSEACDVRSPLSASPPRKIRDLPRSFILGELERYYRARPEPGIVESDYALWQCAETGLQFAWPLLPGNAAFYEWVSSFESYYPGVRWEYAEVRRQLAAQASIGKDSFEVLDVGCGRGDFLRGLDFVPANCRYALDVNPPAIQACHAAGFRAFCGTLEHGMETGFLKARQFRAVTAFHCLEHVADPVGFVRAMVKVTAPGGGLFLSTPYSPMSFEADWFDILNHPPHHMTRWNMSSYQQLAAMLGATIRCFFPPSQAWRRALNVFRLQRYGPHGRVGKARLMLDTVFHFPVLLRLYRKQQERTRTNQGGGADTILVMLTVS